MNKRKLSKFFPRGIIAIAAVAMSLSTSASDAATSNPSSYPKYYMRQAVGLPVQSRVTNEDFHNAPKRAPFWNLALGHHLTKSVAMELEGFYFKVKSAQPIIGTNSAYSRMSMTTKGVFLNAKVEGHLLESQNHHQYFGGGAGISKNTTSAMTDDISTAVWPGSSRTEVGYQIFIGNRSHINHNLDFTFDLRHVWFGKFTSNMIGGGTMNGNLRASIISLGLRYNFN